MTHDITHLADALDLIKWDAHHPEKMVQAVLDALTPDDLEWLLEQKCPDWVAVPKVATEDILSRFYEIWHMGGDDGDVYGAMLAAAPRLSDVKEE